MQKYYYDLSGSAGCIGIFARDTEVIPAGVTVYAMSSRDKNAEYQRYADEYDIHFIFEDHVPAINFYTVPQADIFAVDSSGGLFATIGATTDLDSDAPICYITNGVCSRIATNLRDLLQLLASGRSWKSATTSYNSITFYKSVDEARQALDFIDLPHF